MNQSSLARSVVSLSLCFLLVNTISMHLLLLVVPGSNRPIILPACFELLGGGHNKYGHKYLRWSTSRTCAALRGPTNDTVFSYSTYSTQSQVSTLTCSSKSTVFSAADENDGGGPAAVVIGGNRHHPFIIRKGREMFIDGPFCSH